jgi:hypothetical protein
VAWLKRLAASNCAARRGGHTPILGSMTWLASARSPQAESASAETRDAIAFVEFHLTLNR